MLRPTSTASNLDQQQRVCLLRHACVSQVHQAACLEAALRFMRRLRYDPQYLTMGTLVWQLNDMWQGPSWSSVNYDMRWKVSHYIVRNSFAPMLVHAVVEESWVKVFVVFDAWPSNAAAVRVTVRLHPLVMTMATDGQQGSGCVSNSNSSSDFKQAAGAQSVVIDTFEVSKQSVTKDANVWARRLKAVMDKAPGCSNHSCFMSVTAELVLVPVTSSQPSAAKHVQQLGTTYTWLSSFGNMLLAPANVTLSNFKSVSSQQVSFTVESNQVAIWVVWDGAITSWTLQ